MKQKVDAGEDVIVSLMLDEISIMKHISFDGKRYVGGVDLGDERDGFQEDEMAGDALVFVVVALNTSWKKNLKMKFTIFSLF